MLEQVNRFSTEEVTFGNNYFHDLETLYINNGGYNLGMSFLQDAGAFVVLNAKQKVCGGFFYKYNYKLADNNWQQQKNKFVGEGGFYITGLVRNPDLKKGELNMVEKMKDVIEVWKKDGEKVWGVVERGGLLDRYINMGYAVSKIENYGDYYFVKF